MPALAEGTGGTEFVHDLPAGRSGVISRGRGCRHVLVNGEVTIEDDQETGTASGRLLCHGRADLPGRSS